MRVPMIAGGDKMIMRGEDASHNVLDNSFIAFPRE